MASVAVRPLLAAPAAGGGGVGGWGAPFFWGFFLGQTKKHAPRPPGRVPASALNTGMQPNQQSMRALLDFDNLNPNGQKCNARRFRQAQPEREECGAPASTSSARTSGQPPTTARQISPACDTTNSTSPI